MLSDMADLNTAVLSFESVLKIEYTEPTVERVLTNAVRKLESSYGMRIEGKTLYELQTDNMNLVDNIQNLLVQILECTKTISFLFMCGMFSHTIPVTLSTVKYLGLGEASLKAILRYFQNVDEYYLAANSVKQIMIGLDGIDMNMVKRLFIIMLMLDKLGVKESVAILAQYLYYGSVWESKTEQSYRV